MRKQVIRDASKVQKFPSDAVILPLSSGSLLVSASHAVFCRIESDEIAQIQEALCGSKPIPPLSSNLRERLDLHEFFAPPRPAKHEKPSVQLQLTNACNLSCAYCCTNSGVARKNELRYEEYAKVVHEAHAVFGSDIRIALLGGEPLLVPWALDLAELIIDLGLELTIFTNGTPICRDEIASRLAGLMKQGVEVRVSLAGVTAEACDTVSGAARFEAALAGITKLHEYGGKAAVDVMLLPDQIETIVQHLPKLRLRLPPKTPITFGLIYMSGRETGQHMFKSRSVLEDALDRIAFEAGVSIAASRKSPLADRREGCDCVQGRQLHVRSDGALFHCFKMEEQVGTLGSSSFAATAKNLQTNQNHLPTLCKTCPLRTICGGGCRSDNFLYTKTGEPVCAPWRVQVLCELLAEDNPEAVEWPVEHLLTEARSRGIDAPETIQPLRISSHLVAV